MTDVERRERIWSALRHRASAWRAPLALFAISYAVLALFSGQRFVRQSEAPHFVYQAGAWLEGRASVERERLPNLEDWACVREQQGRKVRCDGTPRLDDRWYVSFPAFPAVVMLPFVALRGYRFDDTAFGIFVAALAVACFYTLLRRLAEERETHRSPTDNVVIALSLAFGTLFFSCSIRGEVWFVAEVMGVALTSLYVKATLRARRPALAGLLYSMAALTRPPLIFAGPLFILEALCPGPAGRCRPLARLRADPAPAARRLGLFAAGAAPLAALGAAYNYVRFGTFAEFGHRFLYNNRVNADIDRYGLFHLHYLGRNLKAAFLTFPRLSLRTPGLTYDPNGLCLLLTLPIAVFLLWPRERPRLHGPLWLTVALIAVPGLLYQNTGSMQFGFRFSLDYTPYLLLLFALGAWPLRNRWVQGALALGVLVNLWGAIAFRGYTELVRHWSP